MHSTNLYFYIFEVSIWFNVVNRFSFLGAILIFLPGYDEIISLRDRIIFDDKRFVDNAHR